MAQNCNSCFCSSEAAFHPKNCVPWSKLTGSFSIHRRTIDAKYCSAAVRLVYHLFNFSIDQAIDCYNNRKLNKVIDLCFICKSRTPEQSFNVKTLKIHVC